MTDQIKFALEFPQGSILMTATGGAYFNPSNSTDAFMVYGERKELFGKNAITVSQDRTTGAGGYSVVYEFAANDYRLMKGNETVRGTLADDATVACLNQALAQNKIKLYTPQDTRPATVYNVARFADGRLLIQLANKSELYLGKDGDFKKLDAIPTLQGGGSKYYKLTTGEQIALPYGYGGPNGEIPTFNGEELIWLNVKSGEDPAKFGLKIEAGVAPLDPFSPKQETQKPRPTTKGDFNF